MSGTLTASWSVSWMPSRSRACAFTTPQVDMPPRFMSLPLPNSPSTRSRLVISLPVATGSPAALNLILAQEHLVRGGRGVGLVLVDERRCLVDVLVDVVGALVNKGRQGIVTQDAVGTGLIGGPRQQHEAQVGRQIVGECLVYQSAPAMSGSSGLQRNEHRAAAALLQQIEAVVEELAEEHEPQVERCGQALVRRHVLKREIGDIVSGAENAILAGTHAEDARRPRSAHRQGCPKRRPRRHSPPPPPPPGSCWSGRRSGWR